MTNSMNEELLRLAERCEAASGPDRELDFAIYAAINPDGRSDKFLAEIKPKHRYLYGEPYTASLDAAMQLVPEGFAPELRQNSISGRWYASLTPFDTESIQCFDAIDTATPALALCAASLRAKAMMGEGE